METYDLVDLGGPFYVHVEGRLVRGPRLRF